MTNLLNSQALAGRRLDALGAAALVLLTLAGYFLGVRPASDRSSAVGLQQSTLASRKNEVKEAQQALNALQRQVGELRATLASQPVNLLAPDRSNERMAELARLVSDHGLVVHEMQSSPAVSLPRFKLVPIHLSGRGTFPQCSSFLRDLHARHRDMGPWTIELVDNPADRDAQLDFRFEVTWYAAPLVAAAAD